MKKSRIYYIRLAIIKTMFTGCTYLLMPIAATWYNSYVPDGYIGYTMFGAGIMILGNIMLLAQAWGLAFDKDLRDQINNQDADT